MNPQPRGENLQKFCVAGLVTAYEFQRAQYLIAQLCKCYPKEFSPPDIRPMLDISWYEFLVKVRRRYGGDLWKLRNEVAIFLNGRFFGDDEVLIKYIFTHHSLRVDVNFNESGTQQVVEYFQDMLDLGRTFAYIIFNIEQKTTGSVLVMLYNDLVPKTCEFFMEETKVRYGGLRQSKVARVVKNSWIQINGTPVSTNDLPSENFTIPHNRRGVLSMANAHKGGNWNQYLISLEPTEWMDHKYVAFGQVIQGEHVLKCIEDTATVYQAPECKIGIVSCGEFSVPSPTITGPTAAVATASATANAAANQLDASPSFAVRSSATADHPQDLPSNLSLASYLAGLYCMSSDLKSHVPLIHLPERLLNYFYEQKKMDDMIAEEEEYSYGDSEEGEGDTPAGYNMSLFMSVDSLTNYNDLNRSKGFIIRHRN